ncbi:capsular biosynthesis protein [Oecophyllibacter saccharovorans]|uniref:Capsular biosynthesis protein n=1 Tax=Oecophyllibacter saccharovorans TaxID=2558360 RepID=A0A506URW1_9PROT|nr:capsular biosynthesis protein [Oecophyllibacter saccharovorans]TPW36084.1 capsular biosynthesis protein [Oecophyllibacter saccharovorans]
MNKVPSVGLITSGAFVNQELIAEFGLLPPSFLPLGVGRLYDMQIDSLRETSSEAMLLYMLIPESFELPKYDDQRLKEKKVSLIRVPDDMPLGEAIVYAINIVKAYNSSIRILHGDTVIDQLPSQLDVIACHVEGDDYSWAAIKHKNSYIICLETFEATSNKNTEYPVACGYFSFSSGAELVYAISQARGHFIKGINNYLQRRTMKLVEVSGWYDFGHIQTYFRSRRLVTTARAFNSLQITHNTVRKLSADIFKMNAEAEWFENVPAALQPYTARLLEKGQQEKSAFYTTEYQYAPNLSELYVFSTIGRVTWEKILSSCNEFLEICTLTSGLKLRDNYTRQLIGGKTIERLKRFERETGFDINHELVYKDRKMPSLLKISRDLEKIISFDSSAMSTIMHGDFCFSNILYNSRNNRISVIDPRGYVFKETREIYGDFRYDMAKFLHSVDGLYDFILAGRYNLKQYGIYDFNLDFDASPHHQWLKSAFSEMIIAGTSASDIEIRAITILLFISMLPLHSDRPDRQKAFIGNVLRLYSDIERKL